MDLVQVDVIHLQPAKRIFALLHNMKTVIAPGVWLSIVHFMMNFGRKKRSIATAVGFERPTDNHFTRAFTVDVCGIEYVDSRVLGCVDYPNGIVLLRAPSKIHAAKGERTDAYAGASERSVDQDWSPRDIVAT